MYEATMMTQLDQASSEVDPSPMTVDGTRALVERFYAMRRTQVGAGGARPTVAPTSPTPLPSKKPKRPKGGY